MKALVACFILLLVIGCRKSFEGLSKYSPGEAQKLDTLRIINLLPDSNKAPRDKNYVLYVNDTISRIEDSRGPGIRYIMPKFVSIPAGGATLVFKVAAYKGSLSKNLLPGKPDPNVLLLTSDSITLPAHSGVNNVVFYVDEAGNYKTKLLLQNATTEPPPSAGKFKLRVVNFGYHIPYVSNPENVPNMPNSAGVRFPLQLQYPDSTVIPGMEQIDFSSSSDYKEFDYGAVQFLLYNLYPDSALYLKNTYFGDVERAFALSARNFPYYYEGAPPRPFGVGYNLTYLLNAGGCYSMYVFANRSCVVLDKQNEAGTLDNFGKIQLVNADPYHQKISVEIEFNGKTKKSDLNFGAYSLPYVCPVGDVVINFKDDSGDLLRYAVSIPRLSNYTLYFVANVNGLPQVFLQSNSTASLGIDPRSASSPVQEPAIVTGLNLSADLGPAYLTGVDASSNESAITADLVFEVPGIPLGFDARVRKSVTGAPLIPLFSARLSNSRSDDRANELVTRGDGGLRPNSAGIYTLCLVGLQNTVDPQKGVRLILVKQSNFISKSN